MSRMKFRMFRWPENPEIYQIHMVAEPLYTQNDHGGYDYQGMGPMCRVLSGRGVFCGSDAVEMFNALAVLLSNRTMGELYHPVWGTANAYLTELRMEQESRPDYIAYAFTFREADENGGIPRLPVRDEETT